MASRKYKKSFPGKQLFKKVNGQCIICGEDNYELLDVHRIIPGKHGGKYKDGNVVCLCSNCHRKEQAGIIKIFGWVNSTKGKALHIEDENGNEQFVFN